jgi:hypothetical protein
MGGGRGERDKVNSLRPAREVGRGGERDFLGPKNSRFLGPPLPMALEMDVAHIKIISSCPI